MVLLRYPALPRGDIAPYTTEAVSAAITESAGLPVSPGILTTVETHARDRAPALPGRRPLVVLSPGAGLSRESLTALAEDLASRGYVVAGVDHTYEARAVEFPDGRVAGCLLCERENTAAYPEVEFESRPGLAPVRRCASPQSLRPEPTWYSGLMTG